MLCRVQGKCGFELIWAPNNMNIKKNHSAYFHAGCCWASRTSRYSRLCGKWQKDITSCTHRLLVWVMSYWKSSYFKKYSVNLSWCKLNRRFFTLNKTYPINRWAIALKHALWICLVEPTNRLTNCWYKSILLIIGLFPRCREKAWRVSR